MSLPAPYYERDGVVIYHADCRDILPLLGPVTLVVSDPPYNAGKDYGVADDALDIQDYEMFMRDVVGRCRLIAPNQAWVAPRYKMPLWWSLLPDAHEVVVPMRAGNAIRQGWSSKFSTVLAVGTPTGHPDDLWEGIRHRGEGYYFRENTYGHPGYTPEPIMRRCVALLSSEGSTVLDPFLGTGTAAWAAKSLGRKAIGIEINEEYCRIAAMRLAQGILPLAVRP